MLLNDIVGTASLIYAAVYGRMGTQAVASIQIVTITNLFMVCFWSVQCSGGDDWKYYWSRR